MTYLFQKIETEKKVKKREEKIKQIVALIKEKNKIERKLKKLLPVCSNITQFNHHE